ncbi:LCP family protein [uncultured Eubacterium sp.]|uniref:LCP family glycopolymer transferase n=1 Tax=uncultured Eubacterium sp. TaxID=165185 RepID=UPI0015A9A6B1|nr:LCP family protein [uncultured Eubacterium sp.]
MAKDYNIDDILLEVKKRKEENEKKIKSGAEYANEVKQAPKAEGADVHFVEPKPEPKKQAKPESVAKAEPEVQKKAEPKAPQPKKEEPKEETPKAEAEEKPQEAEKTHSDESEPTEIVQDEKPEKEEQESGFIDINAFSSDKSDEYDEEQNHSKKGKKKNGKKTFIIVLCIILVILIGTGVGAWLYVDKILDNVSASDGVKSADEEAWTGMDKLIESFEPIDEADAREIASLKEMIKKWYYNGSPCSSTHVLNVMLVGEDGYDPDVESRADSAIIASINIDAKTITLTSVLRDTYAYWETEPGNKESGQFGKINGAKSSGDIKTYINAVEHLYKIKIDNYATVDFESFKTIIDTLGGVELEITSAEIKEINNDQKTYDGTWIDKTFEGSTGVMKLTGQQALAYCRIRHIDSDNVRADRQKQCLMKVFESVKDAPSVKLLKIINDIVPYIKTDMSRDMLVKVAKYAISQGWLNYSIVTNTVPNSRINEKGAGGQYYGAWCWKADFPQDAYNLQTMLYGKSSITLARTRVDVIRCRESGYMSDGYGPVGATIMNEHYGEVSTLPTTQADEEDETSSTNKLNN